MMDFNETLRIRKVEEEFIALLTTNVGYTTDKKNCTIMRFGDAVRMLDQNRKDRLRMMKGWKHSEDLYVERGIQKTKREWFSKEKLGLPAFTLTSYAPLTENAKEILNPYIVVDIDNIEVTDELFEKLNSLPFVIGSAISTSGEGVWSVVKFDMDAVTDYNDLRDLVDSLNGWYLEEFGFGIDLQCKNANRLRFLGPYDFEPNYKYEDIFVFIKPTKKSSSFASIDSGDMTVFNDPIQSTGKCEVSGSYQYLGKENEDYYRSYSYLPYIDETSGKNYQLLYKYANAIYRCCGEKGWEVYCNYFPTTRKNILKGYWNSAKGYKKEISGFIAKELIKLGICELDFDF